MHPAEVMFSPLWAHGRILAGYFLNGDNGIPQVGLCSPVPRKRNSKEKQ